MRQPSNRVKSLSINSVKRYKIFSILLVAACLGVYMFTLGFSDSIGMWIIAITYILATIFIWFPQAKKFFSMLKEISYDKENIYVHEGGYEIQVPFHGIKDIELISVGGLYKFTLYQNDQFGKEVICKPSLWYPLNYKRIDKELNRIRSMVRKAHQNYKEQIGNEKSLQSFN